MACDTFIKIAQKCRRHFVQVSNTKWCYKTEISHTFLLVSLLFLLLFHLLLFLLLFPSRSSLRKWCLSLRRYWTTYELSSLIYNLTKYTPSMRLSDTWLQLSLWVCGVVCERVCVTVSECMLISTLTGHCCTEEIDRKVYGITKWDLGQCHSESNIGKKQLTVSLTHFTFPPPPPLPPFALKDLTVLQDHDNIKQLGNILKTNVRACTAVGHPFVIQVILISGVCVCACVCACVCVCVCVLCGWRCVFMDTVG